MSVRNKSVRRFAAIAICVCLASYFARAAEPVVSAQTESSELIARELQRCPSWATVPEGDAETRRQITDVYLNLARYDTATLRAGIARYVNSYPILSYQRVDATDKVFALLRVVFNVPHRFAATKEPLPFALFGNPVYPEGVDLLWPFSIDSDGKLHLTGVDQGTRPDPAYNAVADFDQMAARLQRRFPAKR
jgi:hypothetical protein